MTVWLQKFLTLVEKLQHLSVYWQRKDEKSSKHWEGRRQGTCGASYDRLCSCWIFDTIVCYTLKQVLHSAAIQLGALITALLLLYTIIQFEIIATSRLMQAFWYCRRAASRRFADGLIFFSLLCALVWFSSFERFFKLNCFCVHRSTCFYSVLRVILAVLIFLPLMLLWIFFFFIYFCWRLF